MLTGMSGCGYRPMLPSGGRNAAPPLGAVSLMFQHDVLALMPGVGAVDCRIRVFPVDADRVGELESERTWSIDRDRSSTELTLDAISPGMKELSAALIAEDGSLLGEGSLRYLVRPGSQRIPEPLTIRLIPLPQRRDVALAIAVRPRLPEDPVTYEDVQPVLQQHCVGCHSAALPLGGLQLDAFPFHSGSLGDDQPDIVSTMVTRMRGDASPMPPAGKLDTAITNQVQAWLDGGLPAAPARRIGDLVAAVDVKWRKLGAPGWQTVRAEKETDVDFKATLAAALVGEDYEVSASVFATGGVLLHEDPPRTLQITTSGALPFDISFDYVPPRVTIPIVIEQ